MTGGIPTHENCITCPGLAFDKRVESVVFVVLISEVLP